MAPVAAAKAAPADRDLIPGEIPRDRWRRPLIRQADGTEVGYTRASSLGKALEDDTNIGRWKLRMAVWGLARHRDQIMAAASVATTTEQADKRQLDEIVSTAMDRAGSGAKATIGTALHALCERVDRGEPVPDIGEDRWALQAYAAVMRQHFRVLASELFVVNDGLQAAGTFDRLVELLHPMTTPDRDVLPAGTRLILDVKTSATSDYFGIAFAVQCAVYAGGVPYRADVGRGQWPSDDTVPHDTELRPDQRWALILHVPSGGNTAELHWVDLVRGRELAELAVRVRAERKAKGLIVPAVLDAPVPAAAPDRAGFRILVTGSRDWTDRDAVRSALTQAIVDLCGTVDLHTGVTGSVTVVHGEARGLDRLAAEVAAELGCVVEGHEADWGGVGKAAGPQRNARMVAAGADLCLAFPLGESIGTRDCAFQAEAAGVPVRWCTPSARPSAPAGPAAFSPIAAQVPGRSGFVVPGETPPEGLGPSLQRDAARTRLLVSIGCVRSEDEAAQLWRSHSQVWTDEHTEAVTRRLAELAGRAS